MQKIIVSKFGGTSMGNAECMLRSASVAIQQKSSVVVVSAVSGVTNMLLEIIKKAEGGDWQGADEFIVALSEKHKAIAKALEAPSQTLAIVDDLLSELESLARGVFLLKDCSPRISDAIVSLGERLSSALFVVALSNQVRACGFSVHEGAQKGFDLGAVGPEEIKNDIQNITTNQNQHSDESNHNKINVRLIDARQVIKTDEQFTRAKVNTTLSFLQGSFLREALAAIKSSDREVVRHIFVTQGFIGSTEQGKTTTLGRGGSDYSGALFAEIVNADVLEIWTDVPGIATTDPRICAEAKIIPQISFKEASELATFGAKILHPATLLPAIRKNIPVLVASSFEPEKGGTWIFKDVKSHPLIRAMALRKKQVLITLTTPEMLNAHGFLMEIFKIFNDHKVSVDAITTSEISVAMTVDEATMSNQKLVADLSRVAEVQVEEGLTLVSLIGNNINHTPGLANKIFATISDVNVRMICLGASRHNFCFLVNENQGEGVIRKLHPLTGL